MFYETFIEKKTKYISAYLRDKQIECFTFNIIQQPRTMIQTKMFCFTEAETNKCLDWWAQQNHCHDHCKGGGGGGGIYVCLPYTSLQRKM